MKKLLFLVLPLSFFACKTTQKSSQKIAKEPILMYVGDIPVTVAEFKYVYEKNNPNKDSLYLESSLREYLDLYTKFKLKVVDAKKMGIDTTREFKTEYYGYEIQLARPYLLSKEANEKLVKEAYQRLQEEVNVGHILIKVGLEAEPKDTLAAYNKIKQIRERVLKGEDFATLARQFSEDPSAASNGGNLGYFTALQMVYPFETAAYQTPKGQVSEIVRTEFGYHILKVYDKRPSSGKVTVAHIMLRTVKGASEQDSIAVRKKIFEIYEKVKKGEDFATLVRQFSEDSNTKNNGGQLREFGVGDLIPEFENAAFALKNEGDVAEPVYTPYGWHIIKLISRRKRETFEEAEASIRNRVQRDSRSEVGKNASLARLRKENNLKINQKVLEKALKSVDTTLLKGQWKYDSKSKFVKEIIASFENKDVQKKQNISVNDFFFYLTRTQQARVDIKDPSHYARLLWQRFIDDETVEFEKAILPEKYQEYKMLTQEYREGMMLFSMMNDKVWGRALKDTTGAKQFYQNNKEKYKWGERAFATIFDAANENVLKEVEERLTEKPPYLLKNYLKEPLIKYNKDQLIVDKKYTDRLIEIATELNNDPSLLLEISGHMDKSERPKTLSADRTKHIFDYLFNKNVNPNQMIRKDFGSSVPGTKKDGKPNSRVELQMFTYSLKGIEKQVNATNALNLKVTELRPYEKGSNPILNQVEWKEGKHKLSQNGRLVMVNISSIEKPRIKTYEEARGSVISDYQVFLENEWVLSLKNLYPVKLQEEEFKKLIKK
jgi:peptidyl-prolyl cis-trans isomerase SurA